MLTNLIASVVITLVTNTVATDNAIYVPDYSFYYATFPAQYGQVLVTPATERYVTTTVTEHTEVTVPIRGTPHTFTDDHLLSSVTKIMQKLEEWREQGTRTNQDSTIIPINQHTTNSIFPTDIPQHNSLYYYKPMAWPLDAPSSGVTNHVGVMP